MKIVSLIVAAAALAGVGAGGAAGASIVDQEQPLIAGTVGGVAVGGFYDQKIAQTVTPGVNGRLVAVALPVACHGETELLVEIQAVTAGKPNGTVLARFSVPAAQLPSFFPAPPTLRQLELPAPVEQRAGTPFAIVLDSPGDCGMFRGPVGDSYAGGNGYFDSRPNPVGVWVCMCEFTGERWDFPFRTFVAADSTPPVLTVPPELIADATSPDGAWVDYSVTVSDETDANPRVECTPPSGSTFAIGDTIVRCTATDAAGNTTVASFAVSVRGAEQQAQTLRERVARLAHAGVAKSLASKLAHVADDGACGPIAAFVHQVDAQAGKHIPTETASTLAASGLRILAVLGC